MLKCSLQQSRKGGSKAAFCPPCLIPPLWKVELEVTAIRKISASLESSRLTWHVPECLHGDNCALASRVCLDSLVQICASFTWQREGACANKWLETVVVGLPQESGLCFHNHTLCFFISLKHVWFPFVLFILLLKVLYLLLVPVLPVFCAGICLPWVSGVVQTINSV